MYSHPIEFCYQTAEYWQGRRFPVGMESSAQWRLCSRRTIPMDSCNRGSIEELIKPTTGVTDQHHGNNLGAKYLGPILHYYIQEKFFLK